MQSILSKADQTVNNDRQGQYGDPVLNAVKAAIIATATQGKPITPEDVVQMMSSYKMVRSGLGKRHEDSNVDQAGYAEIRDRIQLAIANGTIQRMVKHVLGGWVDFTDPLDKQTIRAQQARIVEQNREIDTLRDVINIQSSVLRDAKRGATQSTVIKPDKPWARG